MGDFEKLKNQRSAAQRAFTRLYNSASSIVNVQPDDDKIPASVAQILALVNDLEVKFSNVDLATEAIYEVADLQNADQKAECDHAEQMDTECISKLNTARGWTQVKSDVTFNTSSDDTAVGADSSDLCNAIYASLTTAKPKERQFDGTDPLDYTDFMFHIETYGESNFKTDAQRLGYVVSCCVGQAKKIVSSYERLAKIDPSKAYSDAKQALKDN